MPQTRTTHVKVQVEPLGEVPNSGLQLPVVSPDGKWIAYLQHRGGQLIDLDALFTGKGLEAMSLYVRETRTGGRSRQVCQGGAA